MAQLEYLLPTLNHIDKIQKDRILAERVLSSRIDAQVTASTDSDADYAAEVADGRVDTWGNEQASLGANIREGQKRNSNAIIQTQEILQAQIDAIAYAEMEQAVMLSEVRDELRNLKGSD